MTSTSQPKNSPELAIPADFCVHPITDIGVYRATLAACVAAECSDERSLARTLRAWVDASPFCSCPLCDGRPTWRNEPACVTCDGDGFVSEEITTVFLAGQAAKRKGVDLERSSIRLLAPQGRRYQDFMWGYNGCEQDEPAISQA